MNNAKKLKFDALDEKNYLVWIRRVQDHMFGKKLLNYSLMPWRKTTLLQPTLPCLMKSQLQTPSETS